MMTDPCTEPTLCPPLCVEILVVGAGLAGLPLAIGLARAGLTVALIDREAPNRMLDTAFDGRTTALSYSSQQILAGLGLWDAVAPFAEPMRDIRVADKGSSLFLHYDHRDLPPPYTGVPFGWIIENAILRRHLVAVAHAVPTLHFLAPARLVGMRPETHGVTATLDDGRTIAARLVIGADGKQSEVRRLAGIETHGWAYEQSALICTIGHERPHHGVAVEHFFANGPFAILPMTENRASIVWSDRRTLVPDLLALDDAHFLTALRDKIGDWLGDIHLVGPRFAYPLDVRHADRMIGPRLALVAEAAHAMHPIAGQGLNLGLRDVAVLAELIVDQARLGLDLGSNQMLAHYERWRRSDTVSLTLITDGLTRLFSNDIAPIKHARGLGLALVNRMPAAKRLFMRHAMGVVGTVPRLVAGGRL